LGMLCGGAVRAVSKNRPKYPMLDIPFDIFLVKICKTLFSVFIDLSFFCSPDDKN
jgi:hypothetical protein